MQLKRTRFSVVGGVLSLLLLALWFTMLRPSFLGGPASYIIVEGISMQPVYFDGDLVILHKADTYSVGDIVAYPMDPSHKRSRIVIHRIIERQADGSYLTQGDNRDYVDSWTPTDDSIQGKAWLHIPRLGKGVRLAQGYLDTPLNMSLILGGIASISLLGTKAGTVRRRRKRDGRMISINPKNLNNPQSPLPAPAWMLALLGALIAFGVLFAVGGLLSFRRPLEKTETIEWLRYDHTATFDYTPQVQDSATYPGGVLDPVLPRPAGVQEEPPPPLYTRLTRGLDLGFNYALKSEQPADVSGVVSAILDVTAKDGWTKTFNILPPTPFSGPSASIRIPVDLSQAYYVIGLVEQETEYKPGTYDVKVIPTVQLTGRIGGESIDEQYAPAFAMKLTTTQITPDAQLRRSDTRTRGETTITAQTMGLFGIDLSVQTVRRITTLGAMLSLGGAGALATVIFLGIGQGEGARVRSRYAPMLVAVSEMEAKGNRWKERIRVASMQDLVRLAQREGSVIFRQEQESGHERYFVNHGPVTYEYEIVEPSKPTPITKGA